MTQYSDGYSKKAGNLDTGTEIGMPPTTEDAEREMMC